MKTLIVCLTLAAFACVSAVQAGEGKECQDAKAAQAKAKSDCSASCGAKIAKAKIDASVKGATLLVKR